LRYVGNAYQLLSVVGDGFKDDPECSNSDCNVEKVSREEEVVVVAQDGEHQVQQLIDERLKRKLIIVKV
jgi:hypothetical protein